MKPPDFDYHCPGELSEALAILGGLGEDAKVLAGGQSLVPLMNFRLARPTALVDLNKVDGLAGIRSENGALLVGSMTRQWDLEHSPEAQRLCPVLTEALQWVGHTAIRIRGTVGGSLAHADPAAELPAVALALGAEMVVASGTPGNRRVIPADDFFVHYFTTALEPTDVLLETRWPALGPGCGAAFEEFALRHGDFAVVGVAAMVGLDGDRTCRKARIVLSGVGPTPVRAREAEAALEGRIPTPEVCEEAAEAAVVGVDPPDDLAAPAGYRRHLARHLTGRALVRAVGRARAEEG